MPRDLKSYVFRLHLRQGIYAVGVVASYCKGVLTIYFFLSKSTDVAFDKLVADCADCKMRVFSNEIRRSREWELLGQFPNFNDCDWPPPNFTHVVDFANISNVVQYDPFKEPFIEISRRPALKEDIQNFDSGDVYFEAAALERLRRLAKSKLN